jgi:hypothetical protein
MAGITSYSNVLCKYTYMHCVLREGVLKTYNVAEVLWVGTFIANVNIHKNELPTQ